jgi:hypothetical protein
MINPLGLIIGIILIFVLKGKPLLWTGGIFLLWAVLAFVPDFITLEELDKKLDGALFIFSMYGVFVGFPIGIICLIAGVVKTLKDKKPKPVN